MSEEFNNSDKPDEAPLTGGVVSDNAQTFVVCAIGVALAAGPVGFELGAFDTVLFGRLYAAWFAVTAALIAFLLLPRALLPFPKWRLIFLCVPSMWMLVRVLYPVHGASEAVFPVLFVLGLVSYLLCLPYALYLIVMIIKPELVAISGLRIKLALAALFVLFLGLGYLFGQGHPSLLSCRDFAVAGSYVPENCTPLED